MNKPYYDKGGIQIYLGDCREILPELPQVDLVITSPPFNLGNGHHTGNIRHFAYEDDFTEQDYQAGQVLILGDLYRIVNDDGSLCYQHKNRIKDGVMITPYEWILKTNWIVKQEIVWFNRSQNFDDCRFYPMTERIYWLAKKSGTKLSNVIKKHDDWHIEPEGTNKQHSRSFPLAIPSNLITCFPEADLILDPFMGRRCSLRSTSRIT